MDKSKLGNWTRGSSDPMLWLASQIFFNGQNCRDKKNSIISCLTATSQGWYQERSTQSGSIELQLENRLLDTPVLPNSMIPAGLSAKRQEYLFQKIWPFVAAPFKDTVCNQPAGSSTNETLSNPDVDALSRIDYCNGLLANAPSVWTDKLQRVLNAAARVITDTQKFDRSI